MTTTLNGPIPWVGTVGGVEESSGSFSDRGVAGAVGDCDGSSDAVVIGYGDPAGLGAGAVPVIWSTRKG
ncbi:MAG TPA: hypothetical protein VGD51_10565, partial [Nocardioidaceae bacterium]